MSKFNSCLRNGHVSFGDDFDTVAEVSHLHGLEATKLPYHTSFNIPGKKNTIAWLPSEDGGRDKTGDGGVMEFRRFFVRGASCQHFIVV